MDYIRKLPLMMALAASIIVGLVGYVNQASNKENMFKMVVVMVVFYIVGIIIRNTITNIIEENIKREQEKEKDLKKAEEEKRKEELNKKKQAVKGQNLDIVASDDIDLGTVEEDFDALPVADFIKRELNQ